MAQGLKVEAVQASANTWPPYTSTQLQPEIDLGECVSAEPLLWWRAFFCAGFPRARSLLRKPSVGVELSWEEDDFLSAGPGWAPLAGR